MGNIDLPGDIVIAGTPFILAKAEQLDKLKEARAWQVDYVEDSVRKLTGVDRNTSQVKDTLRFTWRFEPPYLGYGDSEDVRPGRANYFYADCSTPLQASCPPKINTITLTNATANCTSIIEATDNGTKRIYAAAGRYIFIISPTDDSFATIDCGAGLVAQDLAVFQDYIYIAMSGSPMKRFGPLSTGGSLSSAHATLTFSWFHVANETLFGVQPLSGATAGLLRKAATDAWTAGNWSAGDDAGFAQTNMNKPINLGLNIFVGKPEGLFVHDSAAIIKEQIPELRGYLQQLNFHHGTAWWGRLYLPHETGLYGYTPSRNSGMLVGPETHELNTSAIKGYIREACAVGKFLYIAVEDTSGNTYILKGLPYPLSAREQFIWFPLTLVSSNVCRSMYYSNLVEARLWFGNDFNISYYRLGATSLYDTGDIYWASYDDGYPFDTKIIEDCSVEGTLSATETITVKYTFDGGTERTVGSAFSSETNQAITANNTGKRLAVHATLTEKSDDTATPKLRAITIKGIRRPAMTAVLTAQILCADNQTGRRGQRQKLTAAEQLAQLRTWATNSATVTVVDGTGTSRTMMFMPNMQEREVGITGDGHPEIVATVMLRV